MHCYTFLYYYSIILDSKWNGTNWIDSAFSFIIVSIKRKSTNKSIVINLKCKRNKEEVLTIWNYDWKKTIENQKESTLTVKEYCRQNNICVSSFYKSKRRLENDDLQNHLFVPVEVVHDIPSNISMNIDGHHLEFEPELLDRIIGIIKWSSMPMKSKTSMFLHVLWIWENQ